MNHRRGEALEVAVEAETVDAAVSMAAAELGVSTGHLRYRVVEEPRGGFLGWGARPARIRAWIHDSVGRHLEGALKAVRDLDGHHMIEVRDRDLVLSVFAPLGGGKPVTVEHVMAAVREYEPEEIHEELVARCVLEADGNEHKVALLGQAGERDGTFLVHVSPDGLACDVTILPPRRGGRDVLLAEVREGLLRSGVTAGVDLQGLEIALTERRYNQPIRVANATLPIASDPGSIEWRFRVDRHWVNLQEDDHGRVDFRELDLIESVKAGDLLARRIPPGQGLPGLDVRGKVLAPPPVRAIELPQGENVYAEGDDLRAAIDGHVSLISGRVHVSPFYHVKGDVNYAVGNIDFAGTVCVDGLVEDAFSMKATGSAFIRKSIGKCRVEVGGNLVVVGGILGRQEADIRVGGDLIALFIENSRVLARGEMMVHELILHSDIVVGGSLVMNGTRAALVGGSTFAGGDVTVRAIGGEGTTRTQIRVGIRIEHLERMRSLKAVQAEDEARLAKVEEALRAVEGRGSSPPPLAAHDPRVGQLRATQVQLQSRLKAHRDALRTLDGEVTETSTGARVHVIDTAMAGTRIEIGSASLVLSSPVQYATFTRVGGEIKINPYSGAV